MPPGFLFDAAPGIVYTLIKGIQRQPDGPAAVRRDKERDGVMSAFTHKTLLITGGTGSFGNAVLDRFLQTDIGEIRIFSRDEKKPGRHAARISAEGSGGGVQAEILYRGCAVAGFAAGGHARGGFRLSRRGAQASALLRIFPHGGGAHQRGGDGQCADRRYRSRGAAHRLPVHGQGGVSHQRHGHFQGADGEGDPGKGAKHPGGADHHLLHPVRQRDVQPRAA